MLGMRALANHIINIARKNGINITNLQLQKVMFFTLGLHIRNIHGVDQLVSGTYDEPFEKWKYGPVVESVYYEYNKYQNRPITEPGIYDEDYAEWDTTIINLLNIDVFSLVNLSHRLSAWANHETDIINRNYVPSYTLEEIMEDFLR